MKELNCCVEGSFPASKAAMTEDVLSIVGGDSSQTFEDGDPLYAQGKEMTSMGGSLVETSDDCLRDARYYISTSHSR